MAKYGLKRGIEGSKAKHKSTLEHNRDTFEQTLSLKEEVGGLQLQKEREQQILIRLQQEEAAEQVRLTALQAENDKKQKEVEEKQRLVQKAKNEVAALGVEKALKDAGKGVLEGIGSLVGNSKAKRLEVENKGLKMEIENLQVEKEDIAKQAQKVIAEKNRSLVEKESLIVIQKSKMDRLFEFSPVLSEYDFIMRLCELIRIPSDMVKQLFSGKEVSYTGKLHSPEHKQDFEAENVKISIAKNQKDNKPFLALDSMEYGCWFKEQKKRLLEGLGIKVNEPKKQMGQKW